MGVLSNQQEAAGDEDDLLSGIGDAAKKLGGDRFPLLYTDGVSEGFVCIRRVTRFKKRLGKVVTFAVELMLVESSAGVQAGSMRSVLEGTDKEAWESRIARIIMAATGADKSEIDGASWAQAYSDDQPFTGLIMAYSNVEARDKDGNPKCDKENKPYVNSQFRAANSADWSRLSKIMPTIDPDWKQNPLQPGATG